jgi:hypothetical protein
MKTLNLNTNGITSERTSHADASASLISRLRIELTGEPVSLMSIFVSHVLNVATLQNKLSKLGTKAYQVQYSEKKTLKLEMGSIFILTSFSIAPLSHNIFRRFRSGPL